MGQIEEILRRWVAAWDAYDDDALAGLCTADVELYLPRNALEGGGYRGQDGARRSLADIRESWDHISYELRAVEEAGEAGLAHIRTTNVGKGAGPTVTYDLWIVVRVRDGRIAYSKPHLDEAEARRDAGV